LSFHQREREAYAKGYRVSDDGRLLNPNGRQLFGSLNSNGYPRFRVGKKNVGSMLVHRLAAFQKFGEQIYTAGMECRHKDGNPRNFRPDNILIGTHTDNENDKPYHVRVRTARIASAAHTIHSHAEIIEFHKKSNNYRITMQHFGISSSGTLHFILNRSEHARLHPKQKAA
jgi:hypothetical protein